jgi:hypothetical protein
MIVGTAVKATASVPQTGTPSSALTSALLPFLNSPATRTCQAPEVTWSRWAVSRPARSCRPSRLVSVIASSSSRRI